MSRLNELKASGTDWIRFSNFPIKGSWRLCLRGRTAGQCLREADMKSSESTSQLKSGEADAELTGKVMLPVLLVLVSAGYQLLFGQTEARLETALAIGAAIVSAIATPVYVSLDRTAPKVSWRRALAAYMGLVPYGLGIYVIVRLGVWPLAALWHDGFAIWPSLAGCFWILVGWRIVFAFWLVTEQVAKELGD